MLRLMATMVVRSLLRRCGRTGVTVAGVAMATAVLVVLGAIMVGVGDTMVANSVAIYTGHVQITWSKGTGAAPQQLARLKSLPHVQAVLARKRQSGLLLHQDRQTAAAVLGADFSGEAGHSVVPARITQGSAPAAADEILLSEPMAEALSAAPGRNVRLSLANGRQLMLRVSGLFRTNVESLDSIAWADHRALPDPPDEAAVFLDSSDACESVAAAARAVLGPEPTVRTWNSAMPELSQLIELNEVSLQVVLALAMLILAFGVSNTAFMSVSERTREMGILKARGVRPVQIGATVLAETLAMVVLAGTAGVVVGALATTVWGRIGLDLGRWTSENRHFLLSGVVHPRATARVILLPGAVAVLCGVLAGIVPALRAGRIRVVKALGWI